ncbi:MAG: substrate-binding domain-containing protein [Deltaproteobacteria bacterium]|nr:substrate-binding domain-containing protein [Deltaproteobacteria bacterium]
MRKNVIAMLIGYIIAVAAFAVFFVRSAHAQDVINYSCSAQIYEALEKARIEAFTQRTGHGYSDIAATARRLYPRHKQYGYYETLFSKDPVAVIVNKQNPLADVSEAQLQDIFTGEITNWKELGGPDKQILVVVPAAHTASYKNFARNVIHWRKMRYDVMTFLSSRVIEIVERFPWAVSFIAEGAARYTRVKVLKIDGRSPLDMGYPYYQVFSFVTKGEPTGAVKEFIDDVLSGPGRKIMLKKGMTPYFE